MTEKDRIAFLETECAKLRSENEKLRALIEQHEVRDTAAASAYGPAPSTAEASVRHDSHTADKVALFRALFRGREDVYPIRWESKTGRAGYSPACNNEWLPGICEKPRIKCSDCPNQAFPPISDGAVYEHLAGRRTLGVYPLLPGDSTWFIAADFDGSTWRDDALAYAASCRELAIPGYVEISRSGDGAHVWTFFDSPIPANQARKLASAAITRACARHRMLAFSSYDRLFPSQDTLPKGGFGNLITLPLQRKARDRGASVFVDDRWRPFPDQWAFLTGIERMSVLAVESVLARAAREDGVIGVRSVGLGDDATDDPWTLPPSRRPSEPRIAGDLPHKVTVVSANMLFVAKEGLPGTLINRLVRLAAFQNPEFYQAQSLRLSTFGKPRIIGCSEDFPNHLALPRGCGSELAELLHKIGNVVLVAPDIDPDVFSAEVFAVVSDPDLPYGTAPDPGNPRVVPRPAPGFHVTMYVSPDDEALAASSWLFGSIVRLGRLQASTLTTEQVEQIRMIGLFDLIQVCGTTDFFGHGYFHSNPRVSADLIAMLRYGLRPDEAGRPLEEVERPFWRILPAAGTTDGGRGCD